MKHALHEIGTLDLRVCSAFKLHGPLNRLLLIVVPCDQTGRNGLMIYPWSQTMRYHDTRQEGKIVNNTETHLDLWYTTLGHCFHLQH
jgi:hypothetical protein